MKNQTRFLAFFVAALLALSSFALASAEGTSYEETLELTYAYLHNTGINALIEDNVLTRKLKEDYNIVISKIYTLSDWSTELPLLCASGDYPQFIYTDFQNSFAPLMADGYFMNWLDYIDRIPTYRALYTDYQWNAYLGTRLQPDGGLYFLPQWRAWKCYVGWLYRADIFEANGIPVPQTIDEIDTACAAWKEIYPDSYPIVAKWGFGDLLVLFRNAYNVPQSNGYGIDAVTGEFIPNTRVTDNYRAMMAHMARLYAAGYIDPEITSMSLPVWQERFYNRQPAFCVNAVTYGPTISNYTIDSGLEENQNPNWAYVPTVLSASEEYHLFSEVNPFQAWGLYYTDKLTENDELLDRMLSFADWLATDEGMLWGGMGVEGLTFEYDENGVPQYKLDTVNALGQDDSLPTSLAWGLANYIALPPYAITANYGTDAWQTWGDSLYADPIAHPQRDFALSIPADLEDRVADLTTRVNTAADEWQSVFFYSTKDITDDAVWQSYLDELKAAGLDELNEIYVQLYEAK